MIMLILYCRQNYEYLDENSSLPIFEYPPQKYSAERILRILLDPDVDPNSVCSERPVNIKKSSTFIIDITKLLHEKDVLKDEFGKWNYSGSHPVPYHVCVQFDGYIKVERCSPGASGSDIVLLRRLHAKHPSNGEFRRMIAFVSGMYYKMAFLVENLESTKKINIKLCGSHSCEFINIFTDNVNNPHHLCLLTYHFPDNFIPEVKSHGNSKKNLPFFPTWHSTTELLKKQCSGSSGPKEVISSVSATVGGMIKAKCPGQLPRNERQVMHLIKNKTPADELYEVMFKAKQEDTGEKFIQAVKVVPDPAVILATDRQIKDLVRFSTKSQNFCILTVDPTFSLGEFDVTPITYRNLLLESQRTGQPPICIGPIMIHYRKTYGAYLFFCIHLSWY